MEYLIKIGISILAFSVWFLYGLSDGNAIKFKTINHNIAFVVKVVFMAVVYMAIDGIIHDYTFYSICLFMGPSFNIGYALGRRDYDNSGRLKWLGIGTTAWTDKKIRQIGLYKDDKPNMVLWSIYVLMIFIATFLNWEY